jgi:hypothetical protein
MGGQKGGFAFELLMALKTLPCATALASDYHHYYPFLETLQNVRNKNFESKYNKRLIKLKSVYLLLSIDICLSFSRRLRLYSCIL